VLHALARARPWYRLLSAAQRAVSTRPRCGSAAGAGVADSSLKGAEQVERALNALEPVFKRWPPRRYVVTRYDIRRRMAQPSSSAWGAIAPRRDLRHTDSGNVKLAEVRRSA
jgi:hypothetical protein